MKILWSLGRLCRFVAQVLTLETFDGLTKEVGHICRALSFHREAHHHGLASAKHGSRLRVHSLLCQGKTALTDVRNRRLDNDGVAIENRSNEVGFDTGNDGHHIIGTIVLIKHGAEIILLSQIVISEIRIVVDVAIAIHIVKANLYGHTVIVCLHFDVLFHR